MTWQRPKPLLAALLWAACSLATQPAGADDDEPDTTPHPLVAIAPVETASSPQQAPPLVPKFATGFVSESTVLESVPTAKPRSQLDYSLQGAAGIAAVGTPFPDWSYVAYLVLGVAADSVSGTSVSLAPEQITLAYSPVHGLSFLAGYLRIPFSLTQSTVITNVMFPSRPQAATLFQNGADAGFLASYQAPSDLVTVKLGVFDGLSLGLTNPAVTVRGAVLSGWVELAPFGHLSLLEGDLERGPFRAALGGGVLYRPMTIYDPNGYAAAHVDDVRFALALRMAFRGLFVQGEYLQDTQREDLISRTVVARGTYGEASYYQSLGDTLGVAPIGRVSWSVQDEGFFPTHVVTVDAGVALYPRAAKAPPGGLRLVAEYLSERQVEAGETAYGGLVSALFQF